MAVSGFRLSAEQICAPRVRLPSAVACNLSPTCIGRFFSLKTLSSFLFLLGIAVVTAIMVKLGIRPILDAFMRLGAVGFLEIVLAQIVVNLTLGLAWCAACPELGLGRAIGARAVRDAVGNCLPFSQLGGMIVGVRATCKRRPKGSRKPSIGIAEAAATNIVDITTEVLGQIAFILLAIACLARHSGASKFVIPALVSIIVIGIGAAGFIWTQHKGGALLHRIGRKLSDHFAHDWGALINSNIHQFQTCLEALWARPGRIAMGAFLHLVAWSGGAGITYLALNLLGAQVSFISAIAIEGIVCGIMSASFVVPAALGVQEAAYIALGLMVGVNAENAVVISLLRRGRDLAIGLPVIMIWQVYEWRSLKALHSANPQVEKNVPDQKSVV